MEHVIFQSRAEQVLTSSKGGRLPESMKRINFWRYWLVKVMLKANFCSQENSMEIVVGFFLENFFLTCEKNPMIPVCDLLVVSTHGVFWTSPYLPGEVHDYSEVGGPTFLARPAPKKKIACLETFPTMALRPCGVGTLPGGFFRVLGVCGFG